MTQNPWPKTHDKSSFYWKKIGIIEEVNFQVFIWLASTTNIASELLLQRNIIAVEQPKPFVSAHAICQITSIRPNFLEDSLVELEH